MTGDRRPSLAFHRYELPGGARLAVLPTSKLKTVQCKAFFTADLDASVTRKALLPMVLRRGTRTLPSLQSIRRYLEGLYGTSIGTGVVKIGEWHIAKLRLEVVNGRFLPGSQDVFHEALCFLRDFVFDPVLESGRFRVPEVEQEKQNLARWIESLVDQKEQYAFERLLQEMCHDEPYRRFEYGELEALAAVDASRLTEEWREWSARVPLDLYVCGDVDPGEIYQHCEDLFGRSTSRDVEIAGVPEMRSPGEPRYFEERMAVNQGKLCLGFRSGTNYVSGDLQAMILANEILGGGAQSQSKLFQKVREDASLAYDINSFLEKTKGLLFVVAGIAVDSYDRALQITLDQVRALQDGDISPDELTATRESLDNQLGMLEDNFGELIEIDYVWRLHGRTFDLDEYRRTLREVGVDRIVAAARRFELDSVFFLRD